MKAITPMACLANLEQGDLSLYRRLLKLLAMYNLVYIIVSIQYHTVHMMQEGRFDRWELMWVSVKFPVLVFCALILLRLDKKYFQ